MRNAGNRLLLALLLAAPAAAETTRFWEMDAYSAFQKGEMAGLSLRSDGSLRLGPPFELVLEPGLIYLWSLAEDSHGNFYAAGGSPGTVYRIAPDGSSQRFFETPELEIHAVAVDSKDRVYAAAAPDGPVYRILPDGDSALFYNPETKYIWAMVLDSRDNLYVATGDKGEIYRVDPSGQGEPFFSSQETHVRSLLIDSQDRLYAGTDENGRVIRIQPDGQSFVLLEAAKKEVTALALDAAGNLYAAAVGDKRPVPGQPPRPVQPQPAPQPSRPPATIATANLAGGSEVYRIPPDGPPQRVWASREEIVYSLAVTPKGNLLMGTGNEGRIYRLESGGQYTELARSPSSQITALFSSPGRLLAAASNAGRVYRLGQDYSGEGTFTSEVFDAGRFARWGRILVRQQLPPDTAVRLETRSGNAANPALDWSPWEAARLDGDSAVPASPPARFFQWRAVFRSGNPERTPELFSLRGAYQPANVPPVIEQMENTPPGYRFQPVAAPAPQPRTLSLPPLNAPGMVVAQPVRAPLPSQMVAEKGYVGVRWFAVDENDDTLTFSVSVRGEGETEWKLLRDGITEMQYAWDSANWPDGLYEVKITASDAPSNPPGEALTAERTGAAFSIDNTAPEILDLQAVSQGNRLEIRFRAVDRRSILQSAEYSIDGGPWQMALPEDRLADWREEHYRLRTEAVSGVEHTIAVRVTDRFENTAVSKTVWRAAESARP